VSTQIHRLGAGCCWPHHGYVTLLARAPRIREQFIPVTSRRWSRSVQGGRLFCGNSGEISGYPEGMSLMCYPHTQSWDEACIASNSLGARSPARRFTVSILPVCSGSCCCQRPGERATARHHPLTCGSSGGTSTCDPAMNRRTQAPRGIARRRYAPLAGWCSSAAPCCSLRSLGLRSLSYRNGLPYDDLR
jgi:hypothetical protein